MATLSIRECPAMNVAIQHPYRVVILRYTTVTPGNDLLRSGVFLNHSRKNFDERTHNFICTSPCHGLCPNSTVSIPCFEKRRVCREIINVIFHLLKEQIISARGHNIFHIKIYCAMYCTAIEFAGCPTALGACDTFGWTLTFNALTCSFPDIFLFLWVSHFPMTFDYTFSSSSFFSAFCHHDFACLFHPWMSLLHVFTQFPTCSSLPHPRLSLLHPCLSLPFSLVVPASLKLVRVSSLVVSASLLHNKFAGVITIIYTVNIL